jgi:hypothetical protein
VAGAEPKTVLANQRDGSGRIDLGVYDLPQGRGTSVTMSNRDTNGHVVADGVQFLPQP